MGYNQLRPKMATKNASRHLLYLMILLLGNLLGEKSYLTSITQSISTENRLTLKFDYGFILILLIILIIFGFID